MRQFVYISTAAPDLGQVDIVDILEASARNNPERGITGFLLFNGRNFLQLVEGPKDALDALMAQIHTDPRHSGIVRLQDNPIPERVCEKWTMKRLMLADSIDEREASLDDHLPDGLDANVRRLIVNFASLN
jgi:hypothetical protein